MIAADGENAALFHRSIDIKNVIGRSAANINNERAQVFLMLGKHDLSRSKRAEDHVLDIERQFLHAPDGVLNTGAHSVNDVKIGFELLSQHADGIEHTILSIDMVMLDDRMEKRVLGRYAHLARVDFYVLDVLLVNFVTLFRQDHTAAIIKTLNVRPGDADINTANHDVAFLLGIDDCFMHAFHGRFKIDNLAFADAAGRRLANAENFERAIGPALTDDNANFRRADFQADHQIAARHLISFSFLDLNCALDRQRRRTWMNFHHR